MSNHPIGDYMFQIVGFLILIRNTLFMQYDAIILKLHPMYIYITTTFALASIICPFFFSLTHALFGQHL
jgi:hypothetical protein